MRSLCITQGKKLNTKISTEAKIVGVDDGLIQVRGFTEIGYVPKSRVIFKKNR